MIHIKHVNSNPQTSPVALPPSKLVVVGILPTDQTLPVCVPIKLPSELVVKEAFSPPCQIDITQNIFEHPDN
jgi:hypothetical protein